MSPVALGLGAGALLNVLVPQASPSSTFALRTQAVLAGVKGEDENAARRGQVVDGGVVLDDDPSDGLTTKGKRKTE